MQNLCCGCHNSSLFLPFCLCFPPYPLPTLKIPSLSLLVLNRIESGNRWRIGTGKREKFDAEAIYKVMVSFQSSGKPWGVLKHHRDRKNGEMIIPHKPEGVRERSRYWEPGDSCRYSCRRSGIQKLWPLVESCCHFVAL